MDQCKTNLRKKEVKETKIYHFENANEIVEQVKRKS
jgi:hypothetical protein